MPYELRGNCVCKVGDPEPMKCYDNHEDAVAYLRALEANVPEAHAGSWMVEVDDYVNLKGGNPYRLLPFGVIVKNGNKRVITPEIARTFKLPHFKPAIKLGSHEETTPSGGSIVALEVRDDGLYAVPEFTEKGQKAVTEGDYRYHSPEVLWEGGLEDPETGDITAGPMIVGDALLHTPHLGESAALFSTEVLTMAENETVQVPMGLWERVLAALHIGEKESMTVSQTPIPEEYVAAAKERDEFKAKIEAMEAEKAHKARVDQFDAQLKETKVAEGAEVLAGMTDEQAAWVVKALKALSAQIDESKLTQPIGSSPKSEDADPVNAFETAIKAKMIEMKCDYPSAFDLVKREKPELFEAYYKPRKE